MVAGVCGKFRFHALFAFQLLRKNTEFKCSLMFQRQILHYFNKSQIAILLPFIILFDCATATVPCLPENLHILAIKDDYKRSLLDGIRIINF